MGCDAWEGAKGARGRGRVRLVATIGRWWRREAQEEEEEELLQLLWRQGVALISLKVHENTK